MFIIFFYLCYFSIYSIFFFLCSLFNSFLFCFLYGNVFYIYLIELKFILCFINSLFVYFVISVREFFFGITPIFYFKNIFNSLDSSFECEVIDSIMDSYVYDEFEEYVSNLKLEDNESLRLAFSPFFCNPFYNVIYYFWLYSNPLVPSHRELYGYFIYSYLQKWNNPFMDAYWDSNFEDLCYLRFSFEHYNEFVYFLDFVNSPYQFLCFYFGSFFCFTYSFRFIIFYIFEYALFVSSILFCILIGFVLIFFSVNHVWFWSFVSSYTIYCTVFWNLFLVLCIVILSFIVGYVVVFIVFYLYFSSYTFYDFLFHTVLFFLLIVIFLNIIFSIYFLPNYSYIYGNVSSSEMEFVTLHNISRENLFSGKYSDEELEEMYPGIFTSLGSVKVKHSTLEEIEESRKRKPVVLSFIRTRLFDFTKVGCYVSLQYKYYIVIFSALFYIVFCSIVKFYFFVNVYFLSYYCYCDYVYYLLLLYV